MQFAQICDRIETDAATAGPVDFSALPGIWVNSNPDANGIARLVISESDGNLSLQVYAIGLDGLITWGTADVTVFTSTASSRVSAGFTCLYDFGFAETRLQGMILKGLIVLAQFHIFKDDSKRIDYFVREYFALAHGRY
ncbi:MAG: hypothetical protein L0Y67_01470 [Gammaproteobacteria bacterium]|nr:hypothetical protein [Gammaproteobacteria bacterium]